MPRSRYKPLNYFNAYTNSKTYSCRRMLERSRTNDHDSPYCQRHCGRSWRSVRHSVTPDSASSVPDGLAATKTAGDLRVMLQPPTLFPDAFTPHVYMLTPHGSESSTAARCLLARMGSSLARSVSGSALVNMTLMPSYVSMWEPRYLGTA
jgi:hypothetical protein